LVIKASSNTTIPSSLSGLTYSTVAFGSDWTFYEATNADFNPIVELYIGLS